VCYSNNTSNRDANVNMEEEVAALVINNGQVFQMEPTPPHCDAGWLTAADLPLKIGPG